MDPNKNNRYCLSGGSDGDGPVFSTTASTSAPLSSKKNTQQQQRRPTSSSIVANDNYVRSSVKSLNKGNNNSRQQQQRKRKALSLLPSSHALSVGGDKSSKKTRRAVKKAGRHLLNAIGSGSSSSNNNNINNVSNNSNNSNSNSNSSGSGNNGTRKNCCSPSPKSLLTPPNPNDNTNLAIIDEKQSQLRIPKMLDVNEDEFSEEDAVVLLGLDGLSRAYRKEVVRNGVIETAPLSEENENMSGVYHYKQSIKKSTIGQTPSKFKVRAKWRLEAEGIKGSGVTEQARLRMSIVHTEEAGVAIMNKPPFKDILDAMLDLNAPLFRYQEDWNDEMKAQVSLQCIEAAVASIAKGAYTHTVLERLTAKPSAEINHIFTVPEIINDDCVRVKKEASNFYRIDTWEHPRSWIRRKSMIVHNQSSHPEELFLSTEQQELLHTVLRKFHSDIYLQNYMFKEVFGRNDRLHEPIDAVNGEHNPRVQSWLKVVDELKEVLTHPVMDEFLHTGCISNNQVVADVIKIVRLLVLALISKIYTFT